MSDQPESGDKKDIELNEAFARLEKQVEENSQVEAKPGKRAAAEKNQPSQTNSSGGLLGGLALLIGLIALGAASFAAYMVYTAQQSAGNEEAARVELNREIASLRGQIADLRSEQSGSGAEREAELLELSELQASRLRETEARVTATVAELKSQLGTTSEDWLLAEAEYLLRLANQRVAMEDDVQGAIALFEAADKIVREAEGVVAFALREAIANDVAALKAASSVDVEGVFVQIGALAQQVPKLQQKHLKFESQTTVEVALPDNPTFTQQVNAFFTRLGNQLRGLVDYRSGEEVVTPILPPAEEYYLRQNLALKLQLAQLGLLRGNQDIFAASINDASQWVARYFDQDASLTISVLATLEQLGTLQVARDLPDVSGSLREIRKLMANFHETKERSAP